jgi:hypothetical protein
MCYLDRTFLMLLTQAVRTLGNSPPLTDNSFAMRV